MNNKRRLFLNQLSFMVGAAALSKPIVSTAGISKRINTIYNGSHAVTIYHTNDLHGNFGAVCDNLGGINQIKKLLQNQDTNGLLLDAGDFLDSSHSLQQQKDVIYSMNNMGYHAAAIGNHELELGQDHLSALVPLMHFTLLNCNYTFNSELSKVVKPYIIINSGKFKVGITGVGHQLNNVIYNDAIQSANSVAKYLKEKENCDLVICLSHLGYKQDDNKPDNRKLAAGSENIDMIISGHDRKLSGDPMIILNKVKQEVLVSQAAWNGMMIGKAVFSFESGKKKSNIKSNYLVPGQPYNQKFAASFAKLHSNELKLKKA